MYFVVCPPHLKTLGDLPLDRTKYLVLCDFARSLGRALAGDDQRHGGEARGELQDAGEATENH